MLFVLFNNNKVIGCFDCKENLNQMINGLQKNNFCKNLRFTCYYNNSICSINNDNILEKEEKQTEHILLSPEEIEKRKKIEYNLNILKQRKERIEESQRTFKVDLDLYKKFKKFKQEDDKFEIPSLFTQKWNIMVELDKDEKLQWEYFYNSSQEKQEESKEYTYIFLDNENIKERELIEIDSDDENIDDKNINDENINDENI
jgi:ribosomal protein S8